jgi:hypothetical protein
VNAREQQSRERCDVLSRRVEALCGALLLAELLYAVWLAGRPVAAQAGLLALLALIVLLWLTTHWTNFRLLSCGPQAHRYSLSPRSINRPEFAVRLAYHLLINWSVIALMLASAFALHPSAESRYLGYLTVAATAVAWITFNLMHRQKNSARNLLLTSVIAGALLVGSIALLA